MAKRFCEAGDKNTAPGWTTLLSSAGGGARLDVRRGGGKRHYIRSFVWLKTHDPSTIDDLLVSALSGGDKKSQLVAAGTLLAAVEAILEGAGRKKTVGSQLDVIGSRQSTLLRQVLHFPPVTHYCHHHESLRRYTPKGSRVARHQPGVESLGERGIRDALNTSDKSTLSASCSPREDAVLPMGKGGRADELHVTLLPPELRRLAILLAEKFAPLLTSVALGGAGVVGTAAAAGHCERADRASRTPEASGTAVTNTPAAVDSVFRDDPRGDVPATSNGSEVHASMPDNYAVSKHHCSEGETVEPALAAIGQNYRFLDPIMPPTVPTVLTGFAAECALTLIQVTAMVASTGPRAQRSEVTKPHQSDDTGRSALLPASGERGGSPVVLPMLRQGKARWAGSGEGKDSVIDTASHSTPADSGESHDGESLQGRSRQAEGDAVMRDDEERHAALRIMRVLGPRCTLPLLSLAYDWLGGGQPDNGSDPSGPGLPYSTYTGGAYGFRGDQASLAGERHGCDIVLAGEGKGFQNLRNMRERRRTSGGGGGGVDRMSLAARAVRDVLHLLVSTLDRLQRLEEMNAENRRVQERDGLVGDAGGHDVNIAQLNVKGGRRLVAEIGEKKSETGGNSTVKQNDDSEFSRDCEALMEQASWHIAGTVPSILGNRSWPTAGLNRGATRVSPTVGGGCSERIASVIKAVAAVEACDSRSYEMAGVEAPPGLEEGRWLALRRLCLFLGGLKSKDLRSTGHRRTIIGDGAGGTKTGDEDWLSIVHGGLVRALGCERPEGQKLAASALAWLLSKAFADDQKSSSAEETRARMLPLLTLLEHNDAPGAAAVEILAEIAVKNPRIVVPELVRASGDAAAAAVKGGDLDGTRYTTLLNLTVLIAAVLRSFSFELHGNGSADASWGEEGCDVADIGRHLLDRLCGSSGVDLRVRAAASDGLIGMDPSWLIPRLCERLEEMALAYDAEGGRAAFAAEEPALSGHGVTKGGVRGTERVNVTARDSSTGRSAAFQLLGDVIVRGRDPPDALCALLDSLRHPGLPMENATARLYIGNPSTVGPAKHAALYSELLAKGAGSGNSSGCGDESNGKRAKQNKRVEDRIFLSLPLWARRLRQRSVYLSEFSALSNQRPLETTRDGRAHSRRPSPTLMGDCLDAAAIKALAAPADPLPVRFLAVLASVTSRLPALGEQGAETPAEVTGIPGEVSGDTRAGVRRGQAPGTLVGGVVEILRNRMRGQMRLTEALLSDETPDAAETVRALLFSRLTPLLLLKALPASTIALEDHENQGTDEHASAEANTEMNTGGTPGEAMSLESDSSEEADEEGIGSCLNEMHDLLLERISRVYEFDQVTKLAAEVSGKLPPRLVLPSVISRLVAFCESVDRAEETKIGEYYQSEKGNEKEIHIAEPEQEGDDALASPATLASRSLFTACHSTTNHGAGIEPWLAALVSAIIRVLLLPAVRDGVVARVQQGGIDCLAVLLEVAASSDASDDKLAAAPAISPVSAPEGSAVVKAIDQNPSGNPALNARHVPSEDDPFNLADVPHFITTVAIQGVLPARMMEEWSDKVARSGVRWEPGEGTNVSSAGGAREVVTANESSRKDLPAPEQVRICVANAAVTAARRCPEEFLRALCNRGKFLDNFLFGASRGNGLLRAACLQVVFALVYRCKEAFVVGRGGKNNVISTNSSFCTREDVMQVACDALDKDHDEEVRLGGLKLIMGVIASGASGSSSTSSNPTAQAWGAGVGRNTSTQETLGLADTLLSPTNRIDSNTRVTSSLGSGRKGEGTRGIVSPAVVSRAKRLLLGVSNMDESLEARKLAAQALATLGAVF